MKKFKLLLIGIVLIVLVGFDANNFTPDNLVDDYQKEYLSEEINSCSESAIKTYMDYRAITNTASTQYRFIDEHMNVDKSGLLIDGDGFIGVALGSYYGPIGSRYYFTLSSGAILPLVKVEAKSDNHTVGGCNAQDGSVIEFVIDSDVAHNFFGGNNGYVLNGNFNNYEAFNGEIIKVEAVLNEKKKAYNIEYIMPTPQQFDNQDIFKDTSGF